jgi:hypothetical protein
MVDVVVVDVNTMAIANWSGLSALCTSQVPLVNLKSALTIYYTSIFTRLTCLSNAGKCSL